MAPLPPRPDLAARFRRDVGALTGAPPERLGLAVSGGPDSLALLLLAHAAFPGRVEAATVDHKLRPESADEARFVSALCARIGVPHEILAPEAPIAGNFQSAAREQRYRLLADWAAANGLSHVLTAHHLDDQAETLVMRLLRGSGLSGLSGVRAATSISGAAVVRPLLGWRRRELGEIVAAAGIEPVRDPGNEDERYDRSRIRRLLAETPWLEPEPLARSAAALAEAGEALEWSAERLWSERVSGGSGTLTLDPRGLPAEIRRRLLLKMLRALDSSAAPRGAEVQRLLATLDGGGSATLAGLKCTGGPIWRVEPAPPRKN